MDVKTLSECSPAELLDLEVRELETMGRERCATFQVQRLKEIDGERQRRGIPKPTEAELLTARYGIRFLRATADGDEYQIGESKRANHRYSYLGSDDRSRGVPAGIVSCEFHYDDGWRVIGAKFVVPRGRNPLEVVENAWPQLLEHQRQLRDTPGMRDYFLTDDQRAAAGVPTQAGKVQTMLDALKEQHHWTDEEIDAIKQAVLDDQARRPGGD